jgi:hypothetical protein
LSCPCGGAGAPPERRAVWQQFSAAIGGLLAGSRPHGLLKSHDLLK